MRVVRLFGVVSAFLTAGLLLANPAAAQPPSKLTDHITDSTGVLTNPGRAAVSSAIDRLYRDRHIQLWVVYVDNFSRFKPDNWATQTRSASGMGDHDALLAVATNTKLYAFSVPPQVQGLTAAELNSLRSNQIEPAVAAKDWSGAAVAAADGLNRAASSSKPTGLRIVIGVIVVVVVVAVFFLLYRRYRRRRADAGDGRVTIEGRDVSLGQALSTADARLRQVSDYVARHRDSVGAPTQNRFEEAKRYLAAARGKEATNSAEAIAYANRASTLAAQAQTLANADVLAAHRTRRGRGTASPR
ncbi:TPM domain-containing protein [Mycobacterium sp. SMC-2]|uniref:TPM domain-containing protein n=1 Tax=Mycobacterium sp. SMC-2 TaxID=2857058 RepID=UPI0021B3C27B|nr:TPM domain-containing protein [Mycobacterium sp. SMC-2]UXA05149.1 TPM domain-containing protein [Mycobacterium sp. SMC-2]